MQMNFETLSRMIAGYRPARVLHVASSLDIFTILARQPMTAEALAGVCKAKPDMLEKILIVCTAMELLAKNGDRYRTTPFAYTYLVRGSKLYQGHIIAHSASLWDSWGALEFTVRSAPKPPEDVHRNFIMGMYDLSMAGRAKVLADSVDLAGRKKLVDVGGGPGTYSIELCRRFPSLSAAIFDLPETVAIAREVIEAEGMGDRVSVIAGDWDTDGFGEGNDVVLMSNILHGPGSKADMKLGKAFASMAAGGLLIIQDFLLNDDKTGPLVPALFNIMLGAFSRPELFALIEQAGFVKPRVLSTIDEAGSLVIEAEKPCAQ